MIGIFCANVYGLIVSPFGGSDSRFGTNPWCFALPAKEGQVSTHPHTHPTLFQLFLPEP